MIVGRLLRSPIGEIPRIPTAGWELGTAFRAADLPGWGHLIERLRAAGGAPGNGGTWRIGVWDRMEGGPVVRTDLIYGPPDLPVYAIGHTVGANGARFYLFKGARRLSGLIWTRCDGTLSIVHLRATIGVSHA